MCTEFIERLGSVCCIVVFLHVSYGSLIIEPSRQPAGSSTTNCSAVCNYKMRRIVHPILQNVHFGNRIQLETSNPSEFSIKQFGLLGPSSLKREEAVDLEFPPLIFRAHPTFVNLLTPGIRVRQSRTSVARFPRLSSPTNVHKYTTPLPPRKLNSVR